MFPTLSHQAFKMEINNYTGNCSEVISVCCLFFLPFPSENMGGKATDGEL